jgi:hypothetical protein
MAHLKRKNKNCDKTYKIKYYDKLDVKNEFRNEKIRYENY